MSTSFKSAFLLVFPLFFSPDSLFLPSQKHFIPLANLFPLVLLCFLSCLSPSFFSLHPCRHLTSPPSLPSCTLFLPPFPFASSPSSLQTAIFSHVNGRVLCGCGLTVVCLRCHCGSFCSLPCCFTSCGPGRLPGWPAGWLTDWLLRNWGGRANACTHTSPQACHKLFSCVAWDTGQPSASCCCSVPSLMLPVV